MQPATIEPVGLQDIKWRELRDKWGVYVPQEKKLQWKYYNEAPPAAMKDAIAKQTKEARKQRKSQSRTVHNINEKPCKVQKKDDSDSEGMTTGVI